MTAPLPTPEEIRDREMAWITRRITQARLILLPIGALFLTLLVLYDREPWKLALLAVVVAGLGTIGVFDLLRLRRARERPSPAFFDPLIALVLQTGLIFLTGAMESPLLVIYVPLAMISGVALGRGGRRLIVLGLGLVFLWLMAVSGLLGWVPRTLPRFLDLTPGFHDRGVYVLTKAGVMTAVMTVASQIGVGVNGVIYRMLAREVSARRQAVDLLLERNRELVHLSSSLAHELKNPLASIQGLVQLLERSGADRDERERARLQVLLQETGRMRTTLDELLNFSRPLGELTLREVDPAELFEELTALHEGQARQVRVAPPERRPEPLRADPRKLGQALTNLLQNALEATPPGGSVRWVAEREGAEALLGVEDCGPGVSPEVLARLAGGGVTTKPDGSGIGLLVARAIAEQHGGRLLLETPPGGGCRALLRLPLAPPRAATPEGASR